MTAIAGYACLVRKSGTSTAITAESCASISVGSTAFQVTDSTKRVIDPRADFNFKDGSTTIAYSNILSLDFLNGRVSFSAAVAGALTFNGSFLPITTSSDIILETKSFSLGQSVDLQDATVLTGSTTNYAHVRVPTLKDVTLSVDSLSTATLLGSLSSAMFNGQPVITEVFFGDQNTPRFRGFMQIDSISNAEAVDGLMDTTVDFKVAAILSTPGLVPVFNPGLVAGFTFIAQP